MPNKQNFLPFFLVFFGLSLILILFGTSGVYSDIASIFNKAVEPGKSVTNILTLKSIQNNYVKNVDEENAKLRKSLTDQKNILIENTALKSQFDSKPEESTKLIPAKVIGAPGFLPGISDPSYLIVNIGEKDGVKKGDAVLSNNFLVGKVIEAYPEISKIEPITNKNSSVIAKVETDSQSNGILRGQGSNELTLENILLTVKLEKDAPVLTKGEKNEKDKGYPPDLPIGKISSVEKKQSDLFQKARVISPIDFKNLTVVFILKD